MRQANLYRYAFPIQSGIILRTQALNMREGLIVHLKQNSLEGWGEIAPLPSFSHEILAEAQQQTEQWLDCWLAGQMPDFSDYAPSVACGLSFALAELCQTLGEKGNYRTALLCDGNQSLWQSKSANVLQPKVAKLKIGRGQPSEEGMKVAHFLATNPDVKLRLDANRAWSLLQAVEFAEKITKPLRAQIAFIEEPCHTATLSVEFARRTNIAIAWDEALREGDFSFESPHLAAIVIKPMLTGSIEKCLSLIEQAEKRGLSVVISSSLESSLALTQFARLAEQYTPNETPGLDTLGIMPTQLLRQWKNSDLPCVGLESRYVTKIR